METSFTSSLAKSDRLAPASVRDAANSVSAVAAGLLLGGGALAALSGTDEDRVRLGPLSAKSICPFRRLTGHSCPGCGMTRAVALLMRCKPWRATRMHPGAIPLVAFLVHRLLRARQPGLPRMAAA